MTRHTGAPNKDCPLCQGRGWYRGVVSGPDETYDAHTLCDCHLPTERIMTQALLIKLEQLQQEAGVITDAECRFTLATQLFQWASDICPDEKFSDEFVVAMNRQTKVWLKDELPAVPR